MNTFALSLQTRLHTAAIPARAEPSVLYALLELEPAREMQAVRAPVNLVLGIDASESMLVPSLEDDLIDELNRRGLLEQTLADGIPVYVVRSMPPDLRARARTVSSMDYVHAALAELIARLDESDRLSIVAFASQAQVIVPNQGAARPLRLRELAQALSSGHLGDQTYMAPGLELCLQEAIKGRSPDHVTRILVLTDGFARDEQAALAAGQRILQQAVPISTAGLGLTFNEGFLIHLAESTGGNAHLVFEADDIPNLFRAELEATQATVVRGLEVGWRATPGVEVRRIYRVRPMVSELQPSAGLEGASVLVGDLVRDHPAALLLELVVPPRPPGTYRLLRLQARGTPGGRSEAQALAATDLLLTVLASGQTQPAPDPAVLQMVQVATTFRLQTRALDAAAAGNREAALQALRTVRLQLEAQGESRRASDVDMEITRLEREGRLSDEGAKRLRYETRSLTQPLT